MFFVLIAVLIFISLSVKPLLRVVYPVHYKELVLKYSKEYKIDPYLVFAIIKTESKFFPYAKSNRNAKGLMQISNITQKWAKSNIDIKSNDVYDPETNIQIGIWYLSKLFAQYNDVDLVIAAYNGGSGNVDKWLKDEKYSYNGINLTYIPFEETKKYVKRVKKAYEIYKMLYERRLGL